MPKQSERLRKAEIESSEDPQSLKKWIVIGAGRLGRGLISKIAHTKKFDLSLVVAGKQTSPKTVNEYNILQQKGTGYKVLGPKWTEECWLINYHFQLVTNTDSLIDEIANPETRVISTSVGIEKLREVVPWILRGLEERLKISSSPLLVLICENGRSLMGDNPSEYFFKLLRSHNRDINFDEIISVPKVIVDCAIPTIPKNPSKEIQIGAGRLIIQNDSLAADILNDCELVEFVEDASLWHSIKLYGYNSLHCFVSVFGYFINAKYVDDVLSSTYLEKTIIKLVSSLSQSIINRAKKDGKQIDIEKIENYCFDAIRRIANPIENVKIRDPINRALLKVCNGNYFLDGRIDGPIVDLDLLSSPSKHPELVHTLSLCLYLYVKNIDSTKDKLPFLSESEFNELHRFETYGGLDPNIIPNGCILHPSQDKLPLMEVIADDLGELIYELDNNKWTDKDLADFIDEKIDTKQIVVPRTPIHLPIRCVVFDMDEGLVATESLLYQVTHDLVKEHSKRGHFLPHDEYAECVGMSESSFFEKIIRDYGLHDITPEKLVALREEKYLAKLEKIESGRLVKPGFKNLLKMLCEAKLKLAVYSNASKQRVEKTLEYVDLSPFFNQMISANESGMEGKPSPLMLKKILHDQHLKPENCIVVESSLIGMKAALAAGCYCALLVHDYSGPKLVQRKGVKQLPNAQKLLSWFKKLLKVCPDIGNRTSVSKKEWKKQLQSWNVI